MSDMMVYKGKWRCDKEGVRITKDVLLRDGSHIDIIRSQALNKEEELEGRLEAVQNGKLIGYLTYSFPGVENVKIFNIEVNDDKRYIGVGSALVNVGLGDWLFKQKRTYIVATSDYNPSIVRFMSKNFFNYYPKKSERRVNYSVDYHDKVKMRQISDVQEDPARVCNFNEANAYR